MTILKNWIASRLGSTPLAVKIIFALPLPANISTQQHPLDGWHQTLIRSHAFHWEHSHNAVTEILSMARSTMLPHQNHGSGYKQIYSFLSQTNGPTKHESNQPYPVDPIASMYLPSGKRVKDGSHGSSKKDTKPHGHRCNVHVQLALASRKTILEQILLDTNQQNLHIASNVAPHSSSSIRSTMLLYLATASISPTSHTTNYGTTFRNGLLAFLGHANMIMIFIIHCAAKTMPAHGAMLKGQNTNSSKEHSCNMKA